MSNRHLSRTIAMQTLFEWDFNHRSLKLQKLIDQNRETFAPGLGDDEFIEFLVHGVTKHLEEIDGYITTYAPEWPLDKITAIDRNILRLGIFELKYSQEIPPKVAINEAIELAKTFGGPSSGKFVNGVLGSIYKDMVNKGEIKEEEEQKISPKQETENIPQEVSAGGVVYNNEKEKNYIVLIKDGIGKWTFPKGHLNEGEDIKTAALREVSEETGLKKLKIKAELGQIEIIVNEPGKQPRPKIVHYFLMETKDKKVTREKNHPGVQDVGWFLLDDVEKILGYQNSKEIFNKALTILK